MPLGSGLATPDVVDKDQDFLSGIWVSTALVPQMKTKTRRVKSLLLQYVAKCIYCKLRNCKVHKRNNKGKCNVPVFNDS